LALPGGARIIGSKCGTPLAAIMARSDPPRRHQQDQRREEERVSAMPRRFAAAVMVVLLALASGAFAQPANGRAQDQEALTPAENAVWEKHRHHADGLELEEAEAVLRDWMNRNPGSARACGWLAEFYLHDFQGRPARFDDGMTLAEHCIALDSPTNPTSRQTLANKYWEKAYRDPSLTDEQKERYADRGLKYADEALKINPNLVDSIVFKGLLLRVKAVATRDEKKRQKYLYEASLLQNEATELRRNGKGELSGAAGPSVGISAAAPPSGHTSRVSGGLPEGVVGGVVSAPAPPPVAGPVRVGGQIREPRKTKHVEFVYPSIARSARVQGVVILECTISPEGKVVDVRVLRSIPLLDSAAIEAIKQWEYTPTVLNGVPVPVIMTVTANFTLS
jgi:TonB family protein